MYGHIYVATLDTEWMYLMAVQVLIPEKTRPSECVFAANVRNQAHLCLDSAAWADRFVFIKNFVVGGTIYNPNSCCDHTAYSRLNRACIRGLLAVSQ